MSEKKKQTIVEAITERARALDAHELFNVVAELSSLLSDKNKTPEARKAVARALKPIIEKFESVTGRQMPLKKRLAKSLTPRKKKKTTATRPRAKHRLGD